MNDAQRRDLPRNAVTGDGPPQPGVVYWITGLAGAGKTTIGRCLAHRLRQLGRSVVFLDGNALRAALFPEAGYAPAERLALARRYSRLCGFLAEQGHDVVCATISLFPEIWAQNRRDLAAYREILIRAPLAVRTSRKAALYEHAAVEHVVGRDETVAEPPAADVQLDNDGSRSAPDLVDELLSRLGVLEPLEDARE